MALRKIMDETKPHIEDVKEHYTAQLHLETALLFIRKLHHRVTFRENIDTQRDSGGSDGNQEGSADSKYHQGQGT